MRAKLTSNRKGRAGGSHGLGSRWLVPSHTVASEEASTCSRKESALRRPHQQEVDEIAKDYRCTLVAVSPDSWDGSL